MAGKITNQELDTSLANTIDSKAPIESPVFTGTVSGVTAEMVGLGNVTNESKITMFTNPTFTGTVSGVTASMVGLGNVTNESKTTMFTSPTFTGTATLPTTNNYATSTTTNEKVGHDTMSGTSKTVTDAFITANTFVTIIPLSNPAGVMTVTSNDGNFVITSTKSEALTFKWSAIK